MRGDVRLAFAVSAALVAAGEAGAIRFDWTPDEIRCASTVGVDLPGDPRTDEPGYARRLAWLADVIVHAKVVAVRQIDRPGFATFVDLDVLRVKKGRLVGLRVTVPLESGSWYDSMTGQTLSAKLVNEPEFVVGETVVLFLTKGTADGPPDDPGRYRLTRKQYRLVNSSKWLIQGETATLQGWGSQVRNVREMDAEIDEVVAAQTGSCR